MKSQMAFPMAEDWCTAAYAAERTGLSMRSIYRAVAEGRLTGARPRVGSRESGRRHLYLSLTEVEAYAKALATVKGTDG